MTRLQTVPLLSTLLAIVPACADDEGTKCTLAGCADSLGVKLVATGGAALPAGAYVVTATTADGTETCSFVVPVASGAIPECFEDDRVFWFDFAPTQATLQVTRDGATVVSAREITPSYTEVRPNGPDCQPVCHGATVEVTLPTP